MVYLHTMEFIQPHFFRLDLTVERRKLLRHTSQTQKIKSLYLLTGFKPRSDQGLMKPMTKKGIVIQEHNQQHNPDGDLRHEPTKQPPLHVNVWKELQPTANIITLLCCNWNQ